MFIKTLFAQIFVAGLVVAAVGPATAGTVPALAGGAVDSLKATCFTKFSTSGVVQNTSASASCVNNNLWLIGMPVTNFNSKSATFSFRAGAAPASSTNCRIRARSRDQLVQASSSFAQATVVGSWQSFSTNSITVPVNGYLFGDCSLPQTSQLSVVSYTP